MSSIFGTLRIADTDRVFNATVGQRSIYDAIQQHLAMHNAALQAAMAVFVDGETETFKERYKLPAGGRLQARGTQAPVAAVKRTGYWDVAYPIFDYAAAWGGDDVEMAYMTAQELANHVITIMQQDVNTARWELLRALFGATARTYSDKLHGDLTIQPLANGDSVAYPPVIGSDSETTDNHYLATGYTAANVSDANDPYVTGIGELTEHFGIETGNSPIAFLVNTAQVAKTRGLAALVDVQDRWINPGDSTAVPTGLPAIPGQIIGRHAEGGWISRWDYIPSGYILAVHLDAPKPLKMRVDPADTGIARGLALVAEDQEFPFRTSTWRHRFGFGVSNRLNGVVLQLTDGSYSTPSAYA